MKIELLPPQEGELMIVADRAYSMATDLVIDSPDMAQAAGEELRTIARRKDELDKQRKAITSPLDEAKKAVMDLFRRPVARLEEAEKVLKGSLLTWTQEQERLRQAEEERRRRAADEERKRLEVEAEAARQLAIAAAETGDVAAVERAHEVAEHAEVMAAMVVAPAPVAVAKVEGTSVRKTIAVEVTSFQALVQFCANKPEYDGLLEVNLTNLRALARVVGVDGQIPGVRIYEEASIATRRK